MRAHRAYPTNLSFQLFPTVIYCGLSGEEADVIAEQHNEEQSLVKAINIIDKLRYCHKIFERNDRQKTFKTKEDCALGMNMELGKDGKYTKQENIFQIAFRSVEAWNLIDKVFTMLQRPEATSSHCNGKLDKKVVEDINIGCWKSLQGISKENLISILQRVCNKEIDQRQMRLEGEKMKTLETALGQPEAF